MQPIKTSLPSVNKPSQCLTPSQPKPTAEKVAKAAAAVKLILRGRAEINAENPDYIIGFTETLTHLTDEEMGWITDPREGLATRCKYLPTPADVFELIRERRAARDRINPHTTWNKLEPISGPWDAETDFERKKHIVRELLGYDPGNRNDKPKRVFAKPTQTDFEALRSQAKVKAAPPSKHLVEWLAANGAWDVLDNFASAYPAPEHGKTAA